MHPQTLTRPFINAPLTLHETCTTKHPINTKKRKQVSQSELPSILMFNTSGRTGEKLTRTCPANSVKPRVNTSIDKQSTQYRLLHNTDDGIDVPQQFLLPHEHRTDVKYAAIPVTWKKKPPVPAVVGQQDADKKYCIP